MPNKALKILVVEDELAVRKALKERLEREGFKVSLAHNGVIGLKMAKEEHPDLILLDIIMPIMDGITMMEELRRDQWGRNAKIIILTNLSDAEKEAEARKSGVPDYLIKSNWTIEDVVHKVKSTLG